MRFRLIALILWCVWSVSSQMPIAATQEDGNIRRESGTGKVSRGRPDDQIPPPHALSGIPCKPIRVGTTTKFLPDLLLVDQNGQKVRFYSDLIKDKIVLISFFYTSCSNTCLTQGRVFSGLQDELGEPLSKEVSLISVSMDPETDTPERLHSWAEQQGLRRGWTLVTGNKDDVAKLVGHLTGNPLGRIYLHSSFIYIGNDKMNNWSAIYGLAAPKDLMKKIKEMQR